jgi:molybdenum cofactor cytidylyltransferase
VTAPPRVGALLLAAGLSSRMGTAKLALPVAGKPMLAQTLAALVEADLPVLLVTGAHSEAVRAAAPGVSAVHAPAFAQGFAESLKAGLAAAPADWTAALIVLGDMPFVLPSTLRALAEALESGAGAVVPLHGGRRGNPAGIARVHWPAVVGLQGDQGARRLLDGLGLVELPVADPGIHRDLDTPADLAGSGGLTP